jgi:hypothetical protein
MTYPPGQIAKYLLARRASGGRGRIGYIPPHWLTVDEATGEIPRDRRF